MEDLIHRAMLGFDEPRVNEAGAVAVAHGDLLAVALILVAGLAGVALARRFRIPDILVFLLLGIGLGPQAAHLLDVPQGGVLNQAVLTLGAAFLLFDGGTALRFSVLKEVWITVLVLATLGVLVTGAVTAAAGVWFGLPLLTAVLLGAVTAATDPATLVPIFRQVPVRPRLAQTVVAESALNDALGAVATFAVVAGLQLDPLRLGADLGWKVAAGAAVGAVLGLGAAASVGTSRWAVFRGGEPFVAVALVILAYLGAEAAGGSGFLAVFTAGVLVGNRLTLTAEVHRDLGNLSLLLRMFLFVLLGSQVRFDQVAGHLGLGLGLLAVFVFLARPAAVFLCAGLDRRARWTWRELLFLSWTRETGVIPAALVGLLSGMGVPGMEAVGPITFVFILGTILLQAPTTSWLAARLGLLET